MPMEAGCVDGKTIIKSCEHSNAGSSSEDYLIKDKLFSRIRFIEVLDVLASERRRGLAGIFGDVTFHQISTSNLIGLSQQNSSFDIMICSVDDVARLRAILRRPANILVRRKLSFAYSARSSPRQRSGLLRFGFDDVLHSGMSELEIITRIKSIVDRGLVYRTLGVELGVELNIEEWSEFQRKHLSGPLKRSQKRVMQILFEKRGKAVQCNELANYDFVSHQYRVGSLRVTISKLRRKLIDCDIVSSPGQGYLLKIK